MAAGVPQVLSTYLHVGDLGQELARPRVYEVIADVAQGFDERYVGRPSDRP